MLSENTEKNLSKILLIGPALVTVLVLTQGVTDPVNVTKLFALGCLAMGLVFGLGIKGLLSTCKTRKLTIIVVVGFIIASVNSLLQSHAPLSQTFYGVYGRNNGFILYIFLTLCFITVVGLTRKRSFENIVKSLGIAGIINVVYCLWVIAFGDFIGWDNPYGNILGTLGNPNFVGSFLGMFSSVLITAIVYFFRNLRYLYFLIAMLVLVVFEIFKSNAIQGRVLFAAGIGINILFFLWFRYRKSWITGIFSGAFAAIGILGIFGVLQKGPLSEFLYKDSVSLRGQYWYAGIRMGVENLWSGVGFDAYGDWYRYYRRPSALIRPGVETVSNTAHNVYIDLFAFGGLPLLVGYVILNLMVVFSIIRLLRCKQEFDPIFVSLSGAWICYQLQSIISINQVGLAIWGWILGASLIGYARSQEEAHPTKQTKSRFDSQVVSPELRSGIGLIVGFLIAFPPLAADMKWRSAQMSRNAALLEESMVSRYFNPNNTIKYLNNVGIFHNSNLDELAHSYTQNAIKYNPRSYESWRMFTFIRLATTAEREEALKMMQTLDPLNPNIPGTSS